MGLKEIRTRKGMAQLELSRLTGMSQTTISAIENDRKDINAMAVSTVKRLADALGVTIEDFLKK